MAKNNGYAAILALLIVLAIGMMIYFLDMKAIFGPGLQHTNRAAGPEDKPWQMDDLLLPEEQTIPVPKKGQPELLEPIILNAAVQRKEADRGQVKITFGKDCRITASWNGQWDSEKKMYSIQAQFRGNTVPSRLYSDENGYEDKTRLFFIAKGPYTQITQSSDTAEKNEQGTAYLLGWLSPDNTSQGTITITTDQNWSGVYNFKTMISNSAAKK